MVAITVTAKVTDSNGAFATKTATAEIGRSTDWQNFIYGDYGSSWCGVLPGVVRDEVQSLTVEPGGVYENLTVENLINLPTVAAGAPKILLKNVKVIGPDTQATSSTALVRCLSANHAPLEIWDSTLECQNPSQSINGIMGHTFKLYRTDISKVVDPVSVFNNNTGFKDGPNLVEMYGCNLHDLAYYYPEVGGHSDGSHCDGVQCQGGTGFKMWGTRIYGHIGPQFGNAGKTFYDTTQCMQAMMIKPDVGAISGLDIQYNLILGGGIGINISHDAPDRLITNAGNVSNNRFGRDQRLQGAGGNDTWTLKFPVSPVPAYTAVGNVYHDTGAPIRVRNSG